MYAVVVLYYNKTDYDKSVLDILIVLDEKFNHLFHD